LDSSREHVEGGGSASPAASRAGARTLLKAFRWIAAAALALVGFILAIGAVKTFRGLLPDQGAGSGVFDAVAAAGFGAGAYFLVRPDLRGLSKTDVRRWVLTNPLGQASLLYAAAAIFMLPFPKQSIVPALIAQCAFAVLAPAAALRARRWWAHAILSVLGFVLLMVALAATSEALTPRGFGEGGMVFLLPMYIFLILLPISGLVRLAQRSRTKSADPVNPSP
jgi:hypothetical protein